MPKVVCTSLYSLCGLLLLLAGCARVPVTSEPLLADWEQRRAALEALDHWDISGRIAIIGANENVNATLDWHQRGGQYDISLSGPFGQGRLQLHNDGHEVTLTDGEHIMSAPDAETLLQELGLTLPLTGLQHWIRGLPQPEIAAKMVRDPQARLLSLRQAGWDISYLRYQQQQGLDLPTKIFLQGHDYKVRVLVHQWQLPPQAQGESGGRG